MGAINGWRGPGALAIAFAHLVVYSNFIDASRISAIATLVDFFFVLSGILIAQTYGTKIGSGGDALNYMVRRFGRIWPVHAALLCLLVAYELTKLALTHLGLAHFNTAPFAPDGIDTAASIPTNLLLIQSLGLHDRETWNFPSWSLSVEFATYLVFALFCLTGTKWRRVLSVVAVVGSLIGLAFAPHGMRSTYDFGILRCLAGFFAGALTYELIATRRLPAWPLPTLVEMFALVGFGVFMGEAEGTPAMLAMPLLFCGLVLVFVEERGAVSRFFRHAVFQRCAEWSYAIYMVHAVVLILFLGVLHVLARRFDAAMFVPTQVNVLWGSGEQVAQMLHVDSVALRCVILAGYMAAVLGAAVFCHRFIEVPARAYFNRVASRWTRPRKPVLQAVPPAAMEAAPPVAAPVKPAARRSSAA
jgi:peptidoglycan/LPS O-acetylase OafA/YrhL